MTDCTIVGNGAIYGLGIRLGLYLQWTSTVLSLGWVPEQAEAMRDINTSFTISTLIALLYISVKHQSSASEIITVLSLCSGGAILSVATQPHKWTSGIVLPGRGGRFSVLLQNALIGMVTYYQVWFFYFGMDSVGYSSCAQYQFFFTKVSIYGWLRTLNKVVATIWAMVATVVLFLSVYRTFQKDHGDCHIKPEHDPAVHVASAILATKILVFLVLNVELTIRWNNIQGVQNLGSTGEMIPFIVGLLGLIKTLCLLFRKRNCQERMGDVNVRTPETLDNAEGGVGQGFCATYNGMTENTPEHSSAELKAV